MITFTDNKLYVKGICSAQAKDPSTGDILFASNKYSTGNITFTANTDPLRAGMGNPVAVVVESDPDVTVSFTQADFNLVAKMAAVGGSVGYNAVSPVCQTVTATSTTLTIDISDGVPAAPYGYSAPVAYVQKVGEASPIVTDGNAYAISTVGAISGFTATSGTTYKVWYYVAKPTSMVGTVSGMLNSRVVNFEAQLPVYANVSAGTNQGTRVGWLYVVVPLLKLMPDGGTLTGDQSNYDTTVVTGRAISYDESVVSATCTDCNSSNLAYYIYVPDEGIETISGIVVVGGAVSVPVNSTKQIEVFAVMANSQLVPVTPTNVTATGLPNGTTVSASGLITSGATTGDGSAVVTYTYGGTSYTTNVDISVA